MTDTPMRINRWRDGTTPHDGWCTASAHDADGTRAWCEMCGKQIKDRHFVSHPAAGDLTVGVDCAAKLTGKPQRAVVFLGQYAERRGAGDSEANALGDFHQSHGVICSIAQQGEHFACHARRGGTVVHDFGLHQTARAAKAAALDWLAALSKKDERALCRAADAADAADAVWAKRWRISKAGNAWLNYQYTRAVVLPDSAGWKVRLIAAEESSVAGLAGTSRATFTATADAKAWVRALHDKYGGLWPARQDAERAKSRAAAALSVSLEYEGHSRWPRRRSRGADWHDIDLGAIPGPRH